MGPKTKFLKIFRDVENIVNGNVESIGDGFDIFAGQALLGAGGGLEAGLLKPK